MVRTGRQQLKLSLYTIYFLQLTLPERLVPFDRLESSLTLSLNDLLKHILLPYQVRYKIVLIKESSTQSKGLCLCLLSLWLILRELYQLSSLLLLDFIQTVNNLLLPLLILSTVPPELLIKGSFSTFQLWKTLLTFDSQLVPTFSTIHCLVI